MKRILIAFLIFVFLCTASAVFFAVVTQNGILANEVTLYTENAGSQKVSTDSSFLVSALKTTDVIDKKPVEMNEILYLKADYIFGISMGYQIFFNPLTGEACIEKGLLTKRYYTIGDDFIDSLSSGLYALSNTENLRDVPVDEDTYKTFRDNLVETESIYGNSDTGHIYTLDATLPNGNIFSYMIRADFEMNLYWTETPFGTFSIDPDNMTGILSAEPVFNDMAEFTHPVPAIVLSAGYNLSPYASSVDWNRTKPDGNISNVRYSDSYPGIIEMPEPGTPLTLTYDDSSKAMADPILSLTEYRNGSEYMTYDMNSDEVLIPYFEGLLGYSLKAEFPEGTLVYDYEISMNLPTVAESPYTEVRPGDTLAFYIHSAEEDEGFYLETTIGGFSAELVPFGNSLMALVPINWWTTPGDYSTTIYKTTGGSTSIFQVFDVVILPDNFETTNQQLVVSDELAKKADPANTANDYILVAKAKSHSNETSYLDGTFILPLGGEFGTSYGRTRYINGKNPYRHSGLDIDGETGDPIFAGNRGEVVLATELVRPGKTVIIDHGMELFSSYLHMSDFDVEVGDFVEKGDLIGKVGSTGFSTGPHLHWSITLNGNYMSPLWLVEHPVVPVQ